MARGIARFWPIDADVESAESSARQINQIADWRQSSVSGQAAASLRAKRSNLVLIRELRLLQDVRNNKARKLLSVSANQDQIWMRLLDD
jgi:hypothetical protein